VTGRRPDGYHLLDTIVAFADFGDQVTIAPAERLTLRVSGPYAAHAPGDARDLAWRAAEAFFAHTGLPPRAAIHVEKNIPAGAGLGGGSADAAAVLRGLDRISGTGLGEAELAALGLRLGADVPMCLAGRALRARGIGDEIEFLEGWPPLPIVLVWPGSSVSTAEVFAGLASRNNAPIPDLPRSLNTPADIADWFATCRNDLEEPARRIAPVVTNTLAALTATPACLLARMSGSGSACFGLSNHGEQARSAAHQLRELGASWWMRAAATLDRTPELWNQPATTSR
jgi:4-diphosphocytidyl-2-C-methyl-D-erythritol kinase